MNPLHSEMTFTEAWPIWFREKRQTLSERSQGCYREFQRHLEKFFGPLKLSEITLDHVIDYREQRSQNAGPWAGQSRDKRNRSASPPCGPVGPDSKALPATEGSQGLKGWDAPH
jgi:Phage integrase, N-terminal SAM-like domain